MITVTKIFEFEAAHSLPGYDGACARHHGHSYKLEVEVGGEISMPEGMVIDFSRLKKIVKTHIVDKYDHTYLNDIFEMPTAEIMVESIFNKLSGYMDGDVKLIRVGLWETSTSYAEKKI